MMKVHINLKKEIDFSYVVLIESGLLDKTPKDLKSNPIGNKYAIITDSNVNRICGHKIANGLKREGLTVCMLNFQAGEKSKNINIVEYLINKLIDKGLERNSAIIALGGGVVGDVAGFVASIFLRGIPYIQIPTTLMAQVDSSIGGKTAVDLSKGKNLIGTFHHPKKIYIDPLVLSSLPQRELQNGLSEIIKYGVIYDRELFEYLENNVEEINKRNVECITHIIAKSCQIKSEIVQKDEKEENLRAILNYGHTFGHAEENCGKYETHLHGEAVSIGMNFAGALANKMGFWEKEDLKRQNSLIKSFHLPIKSIFKSNEILKAMYRDKKVTNQRIMFVLPEKIGKMATSNGNYKIAVPERELVSLLNEFSS